MVDYKEILRLTNMGYSLRQTAASVRHSHHTIKNVLELASKHGTRNIIHLLSFPLLYCIYRINTQRIFGMLVSEANYHQL